MRLSPLMPFALAAALILSGCSHPGDKDHPILKGKRLSVLDMEKQIEPDSGIADTPIALPTPAPNADWPQTGGNPAHAMEHPALPADIKTAWTAHVGEKTSRYGVILSQPVVADGTVFAMDPSHLVTAVTAQDGDRVWRTNIEPKHDHNQGWGGGIAYDGGRIYVTSGFAEVLALDAKTGAILWRTSVTTPIHGAPTVVNGRIFCITIDDRLLALSTDDGHELWRYEGIPEPVRLAGAASPAVSGNTVVATFSSGDIMAFRTDNGLQEWTDNLSVTSRFDALSNLADIRGEPVIDHGLVIAVGHSGQMVAIDLRTGERAWEQDIGGQVQPWVAGNYVFVVSSTGQVICLTRDQGRIHWITQLDNKVKPAQTASLPITWTGPVLAGDRLIAVSSSGEAWSISPYTGRPLGRVKLRAPSAVEPLVANGTLYLVTDKAVLMALR